MSDSNVVQIAVVNAAGTSATRTTVIRESGPEIKDEANVLGHCLALDNWMCQGSGFSSSVILSTASRQSSNPADSETSGIDVFGFPGGTILNGYTVVPSIKLVVSWTDSSYGVPNDARRSATIVPSPSTAVDVRWTRSGGESIDYRLVTRFVGSGSDHAHSLFRRFATEPKRTSCPGEQ